MKYSRLLTYLSVGWLLFLAVTEFLIAERNSLAAFLTYLPQHPLILPILPSLLVSLFSRQWKLLTANLLLCAAFISLFMGFNLGLPNVGRGDLRVMTVNVARSPGSVDSLVAAVKRQSPDILFLQEVNPIQHGNDAVKSLLRSEVGWHMSRSGDTAILSRQPLSAVRSVVLLPGSGRRAIVAETGVGGRKITAVCVHFATNTPGASRRHPLRYLRGSANSRMTQARNLLRVAPTLSTVIAGDFNLPPRGLAYGRITRRYRDSFSAGMGFGYTYRTNLPVMRIDHVFAGKDLAPIGWRAVETGASDHRAVVVDLAFRD